MVRVHFEHLVLFRFVLFFSYLTCLSMCVSVSSFSQVLLCHVTTVHFDPMADTLWDYYVSTVASKTKASAV